MTAHTHPVFPVSQPEGLSSPTSLAFPALPRGAVVHADASDLLFYLQHHVSVSGIQRVVTGLMGQSLQSGASWAVDLRWCVVDNSNGQIMRLGHASMLALLDTLSAPSPSRGSLDAALAALRDSWTPAVLQPGDLYLLAGAFWVFTSAAETLARMQRNGLRTAVVIYDLIPITHPEFCEHALTVAFRRQLGEVIRFVDAAIAISEHVASGLRQYFRESGLPQVPVSTMPLAHAFGGPQPTDRPTVLPRTMPRVGSAGYVLCVGTVEVRKNHQYLVSVWRQMLAERGRDAVPDLVIVGRLGWRVDDLMSQLAATANLSGKVVVLHDVNDAELGALYDACRFTAFVSFTEGWGLPVGESLARGKVCVASRAGSLPEVGGDFAVYVDPHNVRDGAEVIGRLLSDPEPLAALERRIVSEFRTRDWRDVGARLYQITAAVQAEPGLGGIRGVPTLPSSRWSAVGEPSDPSTDASAGLACAEGWHSRESWGRWAATPRALLRLATGPRAVLLLIVEVKMPPWMTEHRLSVRTLGGVPTAPVPVGPEGRIIALDVEADANGIVEVELETVGPQMTQEERMLFVGVQRVLVINRSDPASHLRGLEELALGLSSAVRLAC